MKLQRSTLILIFLALSMAGGVYYNETKLVPSLEAAKANKQEIFDFEEAQVQSLTVKTKELSLRFERSPEADNEATNRTSGASTGSSEQPGKPSWLMQVIAQSPAKSKARVTDEEPTSAESSPTSDAPESERSQSNGKPQENPRTQIPANEPYVSYLLNLLVKGQSDRTIAADAQQRKDYGLEKPKATVEVILKNQQTHKLILGTYDFTKSFVYAQVDPRTPATEKQKVFLVSRDFENAVNRSLEEWKQPPENSPTPAPEKSKSSPTPAPEKSESSPESAPENSESSPLPPPENSEGDTPG